MARIPIGGLDNHIDTDVRLQGWVDNVRDLRKMQFVILSDETGSVQAINFKKGDSIDDVISTLPRGSTVVANGHLVANESVKLSPYELQLQNLEVTSSPIEPIPIESDSGIDSRLDYRHVDLRDPKKRLVFQVQTTAEQAMREYWDQNGFIEIHSPKLVSGASESGAELFTLDYFGKTASLAQSPQFYKQMAMASGFGKVFEIGPVFRANSSHTSRHDTEFTSVDAEMSWIDSYDDVMETEENWLKHILSRVSEAHGEEIIKHYGTQVVVPSVPFPRINIADAYNLIRERGHEIDKTEKGDLDSVGERLLGQHIKEQYGHEFVFVTDYPTSARPFYHMRSDENPNRTNSFDLLWKGLEVTTGAQREHRYDRLLAQAHEKGANVEELSSYLGFFKHGCPPHGGYGFGLTRMLMNILDVKNVREVTYVYRGPTRLTP